MTEVALTEMDFVVLMLVCFVQDGSAVVERLAMLHVMVAESPTTPVAVMRFAPVEASFESRRVRVAMGIML